MENAKKLIIVHPHGFCLGVARAVEMANKILREHPGEIVYCLHQIVHNEHVVAELSKQGMYFVGQVDEVPEGALLLFSAHGISPAVREQAEKRNLRVTDATCPFVAKVHASVRGFAKEQIRVLCIGHRNHDEVVGVSGEAPKDVIVIENEAEAESVSLPVDRPVAVVTQTTLSADLVDRVIDILKRRFPHLLVPSGTDICYATRNRQQAVRLLAQQCDRVLVLGSFNSSNSQRLVETARSEGTEAILIHSLDCLDQLDWSKNFHVGITSGASTPESFLGEVVQWLQEKAGYPEAEHLRTAKN